jgi:hypothetical protein
MLASCSNEEKVVQYKPFFTGLKDAQFATAPIGSDGGYTTPTGRDEGNGISTDAEGKTILRAASVRQLIIHIQKTIVEDDADVFAAQVLSRSTREEFMARGLDPREAFDWAIARRDELGRLFARMPMGEHTPSVVSRKLGRNLQRIEVTGQAAEDLTYTGLDVVLEAGAWKLRWFLTQS